MLNSGGKRPLDPLSTPMITRQSKNGGVPARGHLIFCDLCGKSENTVYGKKSFLSKESDT